LIAVAYAVAGHQIGQRNLVVRRDLAKRFAPMHRMGQIDQCTIRSTQTVAFEHKGGFHTLTADNQSCLYLPIHNDKPLRGKGEAEGDTRNRLLGTPWSPSQHKKLPTGSLGIGAGMVGAALHEKSVIVDGIPVQIACRLPGRDARLDTPRRVGRPYLAQTILCKCDPALCYPAVGELQRRRGQRHAARAGGVCRGHRTQTCQNEENSENESGSRKPHEKNFQYCKKQDKNTTREECAQTEKVRTR